MRVLNVIERRSIAGGGGSTPGPGVAGAFTQNSPTFFTNNGNGFQVTVACTNPTNFGFTLGLSTSGKLVNFTTGATLTLPADCTITTINTRTGIEQVCNDGVCHTWNLNTGKQISEVDDPTDETGLAQVSAGTEVAVASAGSDLGGGGVGGAGYSGGGDGGGGDGGGGDGGGDGGGGDGGGDGGGGDGGGGAGGGD